MPPAFHIHAVRIHVVEHSALGKHAAHVHVNLERVGIGRGIEPCELRPTAKVGAHLGDLPQAARVFIVSMNRRVSAQGWRAAISKGLSIASLTWSQVRARRAKRNSPSSARATNPATS